MKKRKTLLIPGAGRTGAWLWPLQVRKDESLIPVDYARGYVYDEEEENEQYLLTRCAHRIFRQYCTIDEEFDLITCSMGSVVAGPLTGMFDTHLPGQLKNIACVNPAVFGGPPPERFHLKLFYLANLLLGSYVHKGKKTKRAIKEIKKVIPDFTYETPENFFALLEAVSGVMHFPIGFDPKRLHIWYSANDKVIPPQITEFVAERAGVVPKKVKDFDHDISLQDTEGEVLEDILRRLRCH